MTSTPLQFLRRAVTVVLGTAAVVVLATPAQAVAPEGFETPDRVDKVQAILILGGIPLLLFVAITVACYLPSLLRGERVTPGAPEIENQWLGGPRGGTAELSSSDSADSGGASGRW